MSDIKPSNILLCRNGQVKLCDFGVSGESGTKGDANTFIGTSYYMAPERITGQSYTITSDVWSLGVTLLEVAQHRFPFPADGTEIQPKAGLFDLLTYIVRQPIPKLKDEPEHLIKWSETFKYFIECWYVFLRFLPSSCYLRVKKHVPDQFNKPRKRSFPPCHSLANARTPLDDRDAQQESQHGTFPEGGLGLGMIDEDSIKLNLWERKRSKTKDHSTHSALPLWSSPPHKTCPPQTKGFSRMRRNI